MNRYADLKQRQQQEFSSFPMQFAFSNQQFAEAMAALGLEPTDTDKVYKTPGGGIYRREDGPRLKEMMDRFDRELQEAIAGDQTGDGFIYEMFLYELNVHCCLYLRGCHRRHFSLFGACGNQDQPCGAGLVLRHWWRSKPATHRPNQELCGGCRMPGRHSRRQ